MAGSGKIWGLSTLGLGVYVEGVAAIRQRIIIALATTRGSDPLRPTFGSNIYKYIDQPLKVAIPNIKADIIDCVEKWVPEVRITEITHFITPAHHVEFDLKFTLTGGNESFLLSLLYNTTGYTDLSIKELILNAFIIPNPNDYSYFLQLTINGTPAEPAQPKYGFESVVELFNWVSTNYGYLGKWYLLSDRIVLRMDAEGISTASINMMLLNVKIFWHEFAILEPGYHYAARLYKNDEQYGATVTGGSVGEVFEAVKTTWPSDVDWALESRPIDTIGPFFSNEFGSEFNKPSTGYALTGYIENSNDNYEITIDTIE